MNKLQCPNCGRTQIRYRIRTNDYHCDHCGHTWPKKEEK